VTARSHPTYPPAFSRALRQLRAVPWRSEVSIEEIPSPQRIAPFSVAVSADVVVLDDERGSGRLVLLHDPAGNEAWDGTFRCVTYSKADVEPEMVRDPMLADVGWSWLMEALDAHGATYREPSGTVSAVISTPFGELAGDPGSAEVEIRASWTPELSAELSLAAHVAAWQQVLCTLSGLPPVPPGVVRLATRRGRR
jgi:Protein of unknown function (DUF3000)